MRELVRNQGYFVMLSALLASAIGFISVFPYYPHILHRMLMLSWYIIKDALTIANGVRKQGKILFSMPVKKLNSTAAVTFYVYHYHGKFAWIGARYWYKNTNHFSTNDCIWI